MKCKIFNINTCEYEYYPGKELTINGFPVTIIKAVGIYRVSDRITGCLINSRDDKPSAKSSSRKEAINNAKNILKTVDKKTWNKSVRKMKKKIAEFIEDKKKTQKTFDFK
jgi:hypothetical protein